MKTYIIHITLILLFGWIVNPLKATHLVGGEIYYEYLGNDEYLISVVVYRDCGPTNVNGTGFDPNAAIGIFDPITNNLIFNFSIPLEGGAVDELPVELENPCFVPPPNLCVDKATYTTIRTLPPSPNGYLIVYQRCCRNPSINNLDLPDDTGITLSTSVPGTTILEVGSNSSAHFTNTPPVALCLNAEFFFDHGAEDADGDSLVFSFCTPYHGASTTNPAPSPPFNPPYVDVNWGNAFSETYQITSNPAFEINPETGYITGTATQMGQYVIGVCVAEYRDSVLLNTSYRDFQFNVALCDPNIVATVPEQTSLCGGLTVSFGNISTNGNFFSWDFGDPNSENDTSTEPTPSYTYSEPGEYEIQLIANPGWPCADTALTYFDVREPITASITTADAGCEWPNVKYDFFCSSNTTDAAVFSWDFGLSASPNFSNEENPQNIILNNEEAAYNISLEIEDDGCFGSANITLANPPEPISEIVDQESFCNGFTYSFENNSQNATSYFWDFGTMFGNDDSFEEEPTFTFPDEGIFNISLTASAPYTCPDTSILVFSIFDLLDPSFVVPESQCLPGNSFDFEALGYTSANAEISWDFGPEANTPTSSEAAPQNISFANAALHNVVLTIAENGCERSFDAPVWVASVPAIDITLENPEGCPPLALKYAANGQADSPMTFVWEFGDGTTSDNESGTKIYNVSGSYSVSLTAITSEGCATELTQFFPDTVSVHLEPTANFQFTNGAIDILEPVISIEDLSSGSTACSYLMSDGGTSTDCDFSYEFSRAGYQFVTQTVINEFGCTDQLTGRVFINGYLFFAPNSFTPNNDGLNDFWLPEMTGVSSYQCEIYDRWGSIIFRTTDKNQPWLGNVRDGNHYASEGIYSYLVVIKDMAGTAHQLSGHVTIFK